MRPGSFKFSLAGIFTYNPSGGIIFGGSAVTSQVRSPIINTYTPSDGIIFGGSARVQISKLYNGSGGIVFGGAGDIVANVAQIAFDIVNALDAPLTASFDILSSLPPLEALAAEFDIFEGVAGLSASFDIYSEGLSTARTSKDVQMPIAKVVIH